MKSSISVVILTKNEEKNIVDCIETVDFCNEIIVIDDASEDRTVESAEKQGAVVYKHALDNNFAKQRNFGLEKAKNEWVLFVDADERVSETLKKEIEFRITKPHIDGYNVRRIDTMWGKELKYGEAGAVKLLRLARKHKGEWVGHVHETWNMRGKVGELDSSLQHFPHPTVSEFLSEINVYTDIRSEELFEKKVAVSGIQIIVYPFSKFVFNYFVRRGYKDGLPGLVYALFMSMHSYLVRAKLWELWQKNT